MHRLDGRTKVLTVLGVFGLALCFSDPFYLLVVFGFVMSGLALSGAWANVRKMGMLTVLLFGYSVALWPFFVEGITPVPFFGGLGVTWEGVRVGLGMGLRLLIMLWGGIWLLSTMSIEELAQASQQLGLPSRAAFVFSLAFRWVGMLLGAGVGVVQAQRSRGLDVSTGGILQRIRKYVPLVIPLIGHALRQTNLLAMSLESKGFHPLAKRHFYSTGKLGAQDYGVMSMMLILVGVGIWLRWHGIGTLKLQF
ncbi:MAG: cobalt ABC transporter permease [Nitrospirales bacterium]|nr:MAG: cobalt ABC transporter permease [Nitrospirales bacterium]